MIQNNKTGLFVIFIGFLISIFFSISNLNKYDKNFKGNNGVSYHQMIKYDALRYLSHGNEIKNQLKDKKNFFKTGRGHFTKYLPARIAAAYYYFFDLELFNDLDEKTINLGIHFPYLLFQCFFYFFSVSLLYLSASKIFDRKICFYLILFFCFEPTINQYHASFWSESFLFSFIIIVISQVIKPNPNIVSFFFIGLFLGILSLQKEYAIFYIIPLIIYYLFILKDKRFRNITILLLGFIITQSVLGFNNLKRSGEFYLMTSTTKITLHTHLVSHVIKKAQNLNDYEFFEIEGRESLKWLNKNSIEYDANSKNLNKRKGLNEYRSSIINEEDLIQFDNFITSRTFNYILEYPLLFTKHILKNSIHFILLNPVHIYSDHKYQSGEIYYSSSEHDRIVPYRIFYTLVIYMICLIGFISMIKSKNYRILFFLIMSILYFYVPVSWLGNTRNYVPCLMFISFFFAFGVDKIHKIIEVAKNKQ